MSDCIINRREATYPRAEPASNRPQDRHNIEVKCSKFPTAQHYSWGLDRKRRKIKRSDRLCPSAQPTLTHAQTENFASLPVALTIQQGGEEQVIITAGIRTESFKHNSLELHPYVALTAGFVRNTFIILKSGKGKNSLAVGKHSACLLACSRPSQRYLPAIALLTTLQIRKKLTSKPLENPFLSQLPWRVLQFPHLWPLWSSMAVDVTGAGNLFFFCCSFFFWCLEDLVNHQLKWPPLAGNSHSAFVMSLIARFRRKAWFSALLAHTKHLPAVCLPSKLAVGLHLHNPKDLGQGKHSVLQSETQQQKEGFFNYFFKESSKVEET